MSFHNHCKCWTRSFCRLFLCFFYSSVQSSIIEYRYRIFLPANFMTIFVDKSWNRIYLQQVRKIFSIFSLFWIVFFHTSSCMWDSSLGIFFFMFIQEKSNILIFSFLKKGRYFLRLIYTIRLRIFRYHEIQKNKL